jgi:hypothetical protein
LLDLKKTKAKRKMDSLLSLMINLDPTLQVSFRAAEVWFIGVLQSETYS